MRSTSEVTLGFVCVLLAVGMACATFDEAKNDPLATDGGADGPVTVAVAKRDLSVVAEWPTNGNLDPSLDGRLSKIVVTITDFADGARRSRSEAAKDQKGPYAFPQFESSGLVDAVVELRGADGRLIGYGEARRVDVSTSSTITVVVRKRLLYVARGDGYQATNPREVYAYDLAPEAAEPNIEVPGAPILVAGWTTALALTPDARLLAISHSTSATTGGVAIIETTSHMSRETVSVPFVPSEMVTIGNGNEVLVMPSDFTKTAAMKRVNLLDGSSSDAASGLLGGSLAVVAAVTSADGKKVVFAGNHRPDDTSPAKPYLLEYDVATNTPAAPVELVDLDSVVSLRVTHDGGEILVLGWDGVDENDCTGKVLAFSGANRTNPVVRATLPARTSRPSSIVVHPGGHRIYVSTSTMFPAGTATGGAFYVFDETMKPLASYPSASSGGPEYEVSSAARLPYDPFRVFGGMSDSGNNVHGSIVQLPDDANVPIVIKVSGNVASESLVAMVTPFGQRL
jgi:hypothetical protein